MVAVTARDTHRSVVIKPVCQMNKDSRLKKEINQSEMTSVDTIELISQDQNNPPPTSDFSSNQVYV